jgi:hypothetical protein
LSEQDAYSRVAVARAARRFPVVFERLQSGDLNLNAVRLLAPHLTAENHREALDSARGKNKLQVEEIAARLAPRPDVPPSIRKLPAWKPHALPPTSASAIVSASTPAGGPPVSAPPSLGPLSPRTSAQVEVLSPDRYRVQVTIGGVTLEKLQLAKDMLRHALPTGDEAAILDRALSALLADLAQRKFAAAAAPRPSPGGAPGTRHVPAEVKRAVWLRDLGRCAFVGIGGRRCSERAFVEFHHLHPYGLGGESSATNVQLRCRAHNAYEAKICYGRSGAPR